MARRTPEEAAIDEAIKKERESEDFDAFVRCYRLITGLHFDDVEESESPDFICTRSDGLIVGVELTSIRRSPSDAFYDQVLDGNSDMDPEEALDEMIRMLDQKSAKRKKYSTNRNLLVLQSIELDFQILMKMAIDIPIEDFATAGFDEVWLGDFSGVRAGMHSEIEMIGLFPRAFRQYVKRPSIDSKPYG